MANDTASSDEDLALQAKAGDKQSFEALVRRHKGLLYRFVRRYVGRDDDAYDVVQDTFVSAWMALHRYDERKSFVAWLRTIALNKCRDFGRRRTVRRRILGLFASQTPQLTPDQSQLEAENAAREDSRLRQLDQAISNLRPFYKEPLLLTLVSGLSQEETAAQLNTTTKAIEMRIRRAKMKLIQSMPAGKDEKSSG